MLKNSMKLTISLVPRITIHKNIFILVIFIYFFLINLTFLSSKILLSQEIGAIEDLQGILEYKDNQGEIINLDIYDPILLNQKYSLNPGVILSISLNDGTYITFENKSDFIFTDFIEAEESNPYYIFKITNGDFSIETGDIPKQRKNASKILTNVGSLVLNGTAVAASLSANKNDIYLLTDNYGNQGELLLESNTGEVVSVEPDAGITVNESSVTQVAAPEEIKNKVSILAETISSAAVMDEEKVNAMIEKKIQQGKISDLNGDGIIDSNDGELAKQKILNDKQIKVEKIINQTAGDSKLLTKIVEKAPAEDSALILDKVISTKPNITSGLVDNLVSNNATKFQEITANNITLLDKTIDTISKNENTNDTQLSNIISKVDQNTASSLLDKVVDNKPDLLIAVISKVSLSENNSLNKLITENETLNNKVNNKIVEIVSSDPEGKDKLKQIIESADQEISNKILNSVNVVNPEITKQAIKETVEANPEKMAEILSNSLNNANNPIADIIVNESIASGKSEIITKVVEEIEVNQADNPDQAIKLAQLSEKVIEQNDVLVDQGLIEEDELEQISILEENLASPN